MEQKQIQEIVALLEPSNAPFIYQYANHLQEMRGEGSLKVSGSLLDLKKLKWEFILKALLADRGSLFNLKSFVKSTLSSLAVQFNIDFQTIVKFSIAFLNETNFILKPKNLLHALTALQNEAVKTISAKKEKKSKKDLIQVKLDWFDHFIDRLDTPWWGEKHRLHISQFQEVLFDLSKESSGALKKLLLDHLRQENKRKHVLTRLNEKGKIQIIRIIQPAHTESILFYTATLDQLQEKEQTSFSNFSYQKWDVIIFTLISDRGSFFNMKSFMMTTLHKMAHHFNIEFEELFDDFIALSDKIPNTKGSEFKRAIIELKEEHGDQEFVKSALNISAVKIARKAWDAVKTKPEKSLKTFFILLYQLKLNTSWSFVQKHDLNLWVKKNQTLSAIELKEILYLVGFTQNEYEEIFRQLNPKEQTIWISALTEKEDLFIQYYNADFKKLMSALPTQMFHPSKAEQIIQAFSLSYLMKKGSANKHMYFQELLHAILKMSGIKWDTIEPELEKALHLIRDKLTSTLPLSFAKLKVSNNQETKRSSSNIETMEKVLNKELTVDTEGKTDLGKNEKLSIEESESESLSSRKLVTNAGLVILWPFLMQYFQTLNMLFTPAYSQTFVR